MIDTIAKVVGIFASWGKQETNADNQQKKYKLRKSKMNDKSKDAAEKHFFETGRYLNGYINKKTLKNLHKKYWNIFFENN